MRLMLITPPMTSAISLQEAKAQCRIEPEDDTEDALLEAYIDAATRRLDGEAGLLGRCLIEQEWLLILESFSPAISLPLPPTIGVNSITYVDPTGEHVTIDPERYRVTGLGTLGGATIRPRGSWPATAGPDAVTIEFTAGFGSDPADVPAPLRQAIREDVAAMYQHREAVTIGSGFMTETPMGWRDLVEDYRVRTF